MIVAIDGPAGSGKSTVAHAIARRQGLTYLDTGAMYRTVCLRCLQRGVDLEDADAMAKVAQGCAISFGVAPDGSQTVLESGEDVSVAIRTPEVDHNVSVVSAVPAVREAMVARQRALSEGEDVVAEGRDIGTVVFPQAEVKVFLTADAQARAHRRAVQRDGGDAAKDGSATADAEEERHILEEMERRDRIDSTRKEAPLRAADDAVRIDSSGLTVEQVVGQIEGLISKVREETIKSQVKIEDKGVNHQPQPSSISAEDSPNPSIKSQPLTVSQDANPQAKPQADGSTTQKPKAQAKPTTQPRAKDKPPAKPSKKEGRLRAFRGNSVDDYYDHAMSEFPLPARALLAVACCVVGGVTKVLWRWGFEDGEKLWNDKEPRVIVMNHGSMLDPVVMIISCWAHGIHLRTVYKSEFDKTKLVSWFFSRAGAFPVTRGTADMKALKRASAALRRGESILIYPEGTRIKSDDQVVEIHGGFAVMAQMGHAKVQPLAIVGSRDITPKGTHRKNFHSVCCKVGDTISFDDLGAKGRRQQVDQMEKVAIKRMYELRDELRQEHPGKM